MRQLGVLILLGLLVPAHASEMKNVLFILVDDLGIYYDARQPSRLEAWLAAEGDDDQLAEPDWLRQLLATGTETDARIVGGAVHLDLDDTQLAQLGRHCRQALRETRLYPQRRARYLPEQIEEVLGGDPRELVRADPTYGREALCGL